MEDSKPDNNEMWEEMQDSKPAARPTARPDSHRPDSALDMPLDWTHLSCDDTNCNHPEQLDCSPGPQKRARKNSPSYFAQTQMSDFGIGSPLQIKRVSGPFSFFLVSFCIIMLITKLKHNLIFFSYYSSLIKLIHLFLISPLPMGLLPLLLLLQPTSPPMPAPVPALPALLWVTS